MKHKIAMAALAVVLLVGAGMSFSRAAAPAGVAAGAGQTKWEYNVQAIPPGSTVACDKLGAEGWELVALCEHQNNTFAYFKRPK